MDTNVAAVVKKQYGEKKEKNPKDRNLGLPYDRKTKSGTCIFMFSNNYSKYQQNAHNLTG